MVVTYQLASRLYPRIGPRRVVIGAILGGAIVTLLFLRIDLGADLWWIRGLMFLRAVTMGFVMLAIQAAIYTCIKPSDTGRATSLFSTNRQVAGSLGVALLATVPVDRTTTHVRAAVQGVTDQTAIQAATAQATLHAFHDAFFIAAALYLLGFAFAFFIHDEDAAPSMRRRSAPADQVAAAPTAEVLVAGQSG